MEMEYKFKQIIVLFSVLLNFDLIAQPYYFYSESISSDSSNIYRVDLSNGEKQLFLPNIRQPFTFTWDNYQEWFFLSDRYGISIFKCNDPVEVNSFIPERDYDVGVTAFSVPPKNYLYLSWFERLANESYTIQVTNLLDINSLQLIKECSPTIDGNSIISKNGNFIFQFGVDSLAATFIDKYSIELDSIVQVISLTSILDTVSLYFDSGRYGKVLLSYNETEQRNTPKYFVYDLENNNYYPGISFHYRSHGYLSPNSEYIILQKALLDVTKPTRENITGEISVYKTSTGGLVSDLTLPPDGKILIFDSYPDKFFYYVPETEQAITIDISELQQNPISTYSILAINSIWLQQNSNILSGSVGVNQIGEPPFLTSQVELTIGKNTITPAGYSLKANRIEVKQNTTVNADVYYNELINNGTITGSLNTPLEFPLITALPVFQTSTPGTEDITVQQNDERILLPGAYGDIQVKKNGKLIFTGGEYNINKLDGGESNQLLFQSESEVRIKEKFGAGKESYIGPEDITTLSASDIVFYVEGINGDSGNMGATPNAAEVGEEIKVKANFYVPNGTIWLRKNSEVEGAFIGKDVKVGEGTKVKLKSAW
ncbi:MAG: hypothetical protein P8X73_01885 [Ignavibacteriaceae bacterium]